MVTDGTDAEGRLNKKHFPPHVIMVFFMFTHSPFYTTWSFQALTLAFYDITWQDAFPVTNALTAFKGLDFMSELVSPNLFKP